MTETDKANLRNTPPSAEALRMKLLKEQMDAAAKAAEFQKKEEQRLAAFADDFLRNQVTDAEIAIVRRLVENAVTNGKYEAMVYSFSSALCSDGGRAINNADADWPETLQGKAKEFYERYLELGRPQGFRLKAMIINFPGGIPGDVGFFLSWAPEVS